MVTGPVTERGLDQRERGGIGPQDPWAQGKPQDERLSRQDHALLLGKSALGAYQHVDALRALAAFPQRFQGIGDLRFLIAEDEQALGRPRGEKTLKRNRIGDISKTQYAALLGR